MSSRRFTLLAAAAVVLLGGFGGCDGAAEGLRLDITHDPMLNSEAEVLGQLGQLSLVLARGDGNGGFAASAGELVLRDVDADGAAELVMTRAVAARLPLLRLTAGASTASAELHLMLRGESAGGVGGDPAAASASGSADGVRFVAGEDRLLSVSLDLRPDLRPPRVDDLAPAGGATDANGRVKVVLSKRVGQPGDADVRLLGGQGNPVPITMNISEQAYVRHGLREQRSVIDVGPSCAVPAGSYTLEVSGLADARGPLDQDRSTAQPDIFRVALRIGATSLPKCGGTTPPPGDKSCWDKCDTAGELCVRSDPNSKGVCVPEHRACEELKCPAGKVCKRMPTQVLCWDDCRKSGCDAKYFCNDKTGLCTWCGTNCPGSGGGDCKATCMAKPACVKEPNSVECQKCLAGC